MAEASNPNSKPVETNYRNLGGVDQKSSEYSLEKTRFLNLVNLDFDVPNALSKRPGSTQAISANSSGPINSLFEFQRLDGLSAVVAGSDTAMFYMANNGLTLLDSGWSNGQPTDMLTFVNKLWMANGQKFYAWSGPGATATPAGMPCTVDFAQKASVGSNGASWWVVGSATMLTGTNFVARGVYVAFSLVRKDGYFGPADFLSSARNMVTTQSPNSNGEEWFLFQSTASTVGGATIPTSLGATQVAVWVAVDTVTSTSPVETIPGHGPLQTGNLGWFVDGGVPTSKYMSVTLKPGADTSRFYLYTLLDSSQLFPTSGLGGSYWAFTLSPIQFNNYTGIATGKAAFTGIPFCWFNTNTPKYIEVNQNSMFMAGFSNNPSGVWFSGVGQPENIQPENNFEVRTNDGDRVYGLKSFNNQTYIFKQNSFHKVIGDSADNYELVEMSGEYGCISDKTIVEYRERLLWLDQKGVVEFNGASWDVISTPVEDVFRRMNLSAAKEKAVAVHQLYRNQVWFGIPVDGSTKNNFTVVFDYLVGAWTFFEGFNPTSFALIQAGLSKPTVWRGDYSGMIYYHGESFFGDNGQGITCLMRPHWDKLKENETWLWRRLFLDRATQSGLTGVINAKLYANYDVSTIQATFAMYQNEFQSRAEFGVPAKAVTGDFSHFSASLPLLINGFTWARRFLRNV